MSQLTNINPGFNLDSDCIFTNAILREKDELLVAVKVYGAIKKFIKGRLGSYLWHPNWLVCKPKRVFILIIVLNWRNKNTANKKKIFLDLTNLFLDCRCWLWTWECCALAHEFVPLWRQFDASIKSKLFFTIFVIWMCHWIVTKEKIGRGWPNTNFFTKKVCIFMKKSL